MTRRAALAALLLVLSPIAFAKTGFRPFHSGSFAQVLSARAGQPFLLVLWSVTCAPCRQEFEMLAELRKSHPKMPLVLISTDDIADKKIAGQIIARYKLSDVESWIFAESNATKLRYEIDSEWYGEMPRAYFYDAAHAREAVSGSLKRAQVESWIGLVSGGG